MSLKTPGDLAREKAEAAGRPEDWQDFLEVPAKVQAEMPVAQVPSASTRKCPFCAEEVKVEAVLCKHCRSDLKPEVLPQPTSPAPPTPPTFSTLPPTSTGGSGTKGGLVWALLVIPIVLVYFAAMSSNSTRQSQPPPQVNAEQMMKEAFGVAQQDFQQDFTAHRNEAAEKRVQDNREKYYMAMRNNDFLAAESAAGSIARHYLNNHDEPNYATWKQNADQARRRFWDK